MEVITEKQTKWVKVLNTKDILPDGGVCVKVDTEQIAIFYFASRKEYYATTNLCPHKMQMILSRGYIGDKAGEPKVVCPYHKKSFSLKSGECLTGEEYSIKIYPVKVIDEEIFIELK